MRLLLDTHTLLWFLSGDERLSNAARTAMETAGLDVHVSAASAYEISYKFRTGKLEQAQAIVADFNLVVALEGWTALPISAAHGVAAGLLDPSHRDPFDRLLSAQSVLEGLTLVSNDDKIDRFGVARLW